MHEQSFWSSGTTERSDTATSQPVLYDDDFADCKNGLLRSYNTQTLGIAFIHAAKLGTAEDILNMRFMRNLFNCDENYQYPRTRKTALHYATQAGNLAVVKYLLTDCHAKTDIADVQQRYAIDHAEAIQNLEMKTAILDEYSHAINARSSIANTPR